MGTYIVLSDRKTFGDLDLCLILLPTDAQEGRYEEALAKADICLLLHDPDVERVELSLDFLRRILHSRSPDPDAGL